MAHNNHVLDGINKDFPFQWSTAQEAKEYYLDLAKDWEDPYGPAIVKEHEGVRVVRDDLTTGSKVRGGDCLISSLPKDAGIDTIVYVQPRTGLAGVSILDCASRHGFKTKLFMPSSKRISPHQAACIERGAEYEFHRIAAMPNLNKIAKDWAAENPNTFFVPLGLKHPVVTAGLVKTASQIEEPEEVYVATSTGVLTRSLQIAWPNAKFTSVCVARNMKEGELGRAEPVSHPYPFLKSEDKDQLPPFPCIDTYDGKVWRYIPKNTGRNVLMWNVGKEPVVNDETIYDRVDSYREWPKKNA